MFFSTIAVAQIKVVTPGTKDAFSLVNAGEATAIFVDPADDVLVQKAAGLLQEDIQRVTGKRPEVYEKIPARGTGAVIIGSLNGSMLIKNLVKEKKINAASLRNAWEGYIIQVIKNPAPGISHALVIAGSDRRGTAYGALEVARAIGVSPWYWWADVPVKKSAQLWLPSNLFSTSAPKVKYRGIFINDEAPALSGWSREKFGGFNHKFYEKVFELMLRLKANYLWPAMWGSAFYDDDSLNRQMASDWGIVIGTSHHEPLMRAHDEWRRYGKGKWNYDSNEVQLQQFWKEGISRVQGTEFIASVGMRGDGDEPMTEGTAIALLERIVKDQRTIISTVTGKHAAETPQLWALYKEVQDYYDKGMRVPDDVTLLLCDDNWGNIRRLPRLSDPPRKGGYGIYYHFDYVGGPRNYKWLNTNNIARVWEQMNLAWNYGVKQIWIVNVGDIKPMELPISFFLDQAWDPQKFTADNIRSYYRDWAMEQFGPAKASEIGEIMRKYAQYSARRKPELLSPGTYSLTNHNEAQYVIYEYRDLMERAEKAGKDLPAAMQDAYYQLVLHPVKALTNLHELYYAVALNRYHAAGKNVKANEYADRAKQLYLQDSLITKEYHGMAGGKWNGMMAQTHIGYTYWQQPPVNKMPDVTYVQESEAKKPGAAIDSTGLDAKHLIPSKPGIYYYESDGYVSIAAEHWTRAVHGKNITWKVIPDIGRDGSGISVFPVTAAAQKPGGAAPHTQYEMYTYNSGSIELHAYFSPTLNVHNKPEGLQYAVSIDDEAPVIVSMNREDKNTRTWESWVAGNAIIKTSRHHIAKPGRHIVKFWVVDPGVVLQKIVLNLGGLKDTYLGPMPTIERKKQAPVK
jgi:hypothetical protein